MAELFDWGEYAQAARLYDSHAGPGQRSTGATLLRARIALRSDVPRAYELLYDLRTARGSVEAVWRETLLGSAYALTNDFEAADMRFAEALKTARAIGNPDTIALVGYRMGQRYIITSAPAEARKAWAIARKGRSPAARLDALHLESFIYSREGRLHEEAHVLMELLISIDPNAPRFMEHRAWATHTLAALARELHLPDAIPEVERHLGGARWPDDLRINRFQATKALGWAKALQGDYLNAFRFLKQSAELAPTDAWRAMALCDRSYLARALGEPRWSRQELLDAEEAAHRVRWDECKGEEPIALLLLAELFAPIDGAKASAYLAQFRETGEMRMPRALHKGDDRSAALVDYTAGVVDLALYNRKLAAKRLKRALGVYQRLGYDWRAARCAMRLFDATKNDAALRLAEENLRHYSSSWLAGELRDRGATASAPHLSPMQRRVFRYLCDGMSNATIAEKIGRSENTVANHAKAVLKAFDVSSRSALVATAMKRGLI
jgi:DNA-binding CsgD family transcriptional regulator